MSPIILVGAGILLLVMGLGIGYWIAYARGQRDSARASDIQSEFEAYRSQVNQHFGQTAQHFQELGQQYRSLYEHMAKGADSLCDPAQFDALPGFVTGEIPAVAEEVVAEEEQGTPQTIKDYAEEAEATPPAAEVAEEVAVEVEQPEVKEELEAESDATDSAEADEPLAATKEKKDKKIEEDVVTDTVGTSIPVEPERTVH